MTQLDNRLNGFYRGKVIQHLSHGYCKIFIYGVYPVEWQNSPEILPKAEQASAIFGGCNNGNGLFTYPNIGSTVWCFFANGDQNYPIYFATTLGGENAFGQHELVKSPEEEESSRHLVTAGKSHVEFYENGKISAVVYDPVRTDAKVEFDKHEFLDEDKVIERKLVEKVDNSEISNINCQVVLDNHVNNGEISSQNHYYFPTDEKETTFLSNEQATFIRSKSGKDAYDHFQIRNNNGIFENTQISSLNSKLVTNKTSPLTKETESSLTNVKTNVQINEKRNIDGKCSTSLISSYNVSDNYSYINGQKNSTITKITSKNNVEENKFRVDVQDQIEASNKSTQNLTYTYVNTETSDMQLKQNKREFENKLFFDGNGVFEIGTSTQSKLLDTDQKLKKNRQNKHKVSAQIHADSDKHIHINLNYDDNDVQDMNGTTVQKVYKNQSNLNLETFSKAQIKLNTKEDSKVLINGAEKKCNTECVANLMASDGLIEIGITNNLGGDSCKITMTNFGIMTIETTSTVNLKAPTVNVTGETFDANFSKMTLNSGVMNIIGSSGDCKIGNVSLLQHKHKETQSGDVVSPQDTQTAKASN